MCTFDLAQAQGHATDKCGRCGSGIPAGSGYCQVCGLQLSTRRKRLPTGRLNVRSLVRGAPASAGGQAQPQRQSSSPDYPGAAGRLPPHAPQGGGPGHGGGLSPNDPTPLPGMIQPQASMGNASTVPPQPVGSFVSSVPPSQVGTAPEISHPAKPIASSAAPPPQAVEPDLKVSNAPTMFSMAPGGVTPAQPPKNIPKPAGGHPQGAPASQPQPASFSAPAPAPAPFQQPQQPQSQPQPSPSFNAPASTPAMNSAHTSGAAGGPEMVIVRRDGSEGESFSLAGGRLSIGRTEGEVRFPTDTFISRVHARLTRQSQGVELVDLDSRNGVFVRILSAQQVYPGDHFLLGHQLMRLDNLGPDDREQPADGDGVRLFGTPLAPAWGKLVSIGVGGAPSDVHYLRGSQTVFGRENGDVLFPADSFMSRRHARLRMEMRQGAMSVVLEDLGSANGTYLRLRGSAVLGEGDMFRVGDQLFRVRGLE